MQNQAIKIYSDFINNKNDDLSYKIWHAENVAQRTCKDSFEENNDKVYIMEDNSRLVVTPDNLRVSLTLF